MGILGPTRNSRGLLPQLDVDLIYIQSKPMKVSRCPNPAGSNTLVTSYLCLDLFFSVPTRCE